MPPRWRNLTLVLHFVSALHLAAQERNCAQRTVGVNIVGGEESIVQGLQNSAFQATFKGIPVKIASAAWNENPKRILIFLDSSGSMTMPESARGLALNVADRIVEKMPAGTQIGLAVFSVRITEFVNLTSDRQVLHDELRKLASERNPSPGGKYLTALRDAMVESLQFFDEPQDGDVLYVISDGKDNASHIGTGKLKDAFVAAGVRVFMLNPKSMSGPGCSNSFKDTHCTSSYEDSAALPELVEATGGLSVVASRVDGTEAFPSNDFLNDKSGKPTQLAQDLSRQFRQMTSYLRLTIAFPAPIYSSTRWELKLTKGSEMPVTELVYPHFLPPCSTTATSPVGLRQAHKSE